MLFCLGRLPLPVPHRGIKAVLREKFRMGATLGNLARFQDDDFIGADHGGQPVGDNQSGAILRYDVEGRLDILFGRGVERRGCFIENEDWR